MTVEFPVKSDGEPKPKPNAPGKTQEKLCTVTEAAAPSVKINTVEDPNLFIWKHVAEFVPGNFNFARGMCGI